MRFTYTATDATGTRTSGSIEAASKLEAADKLFNEKGLTATALTQADDSAPTAQKSTPAPRDARLHIGGRVVEQDGVQEKKRRAISSVQDIVQYLNDLVIQFTPIHDQDKVVFFRLLAAMINAGMPIVKSLKTLLEHTQNPRLKRILTDVADTVERGGSFSKALGTYRDVFSEAEIGVIATGETSGQLNISLQDLATQAEKQATMMRKIRSAMIYPATVLVVLVGVFIIVMVKVIPTLADLFEGVGSELPAATRVMIGMSEWFLGSTIFLPHWLWVILFFPLAYAGIRAWRSTAVGRLLFDRLLLRLPLFGDLLKKASLATFTRQLATLTTAGVSIIRSIEIATHALGNEVYRRRLMAAKDDVEQGVPIHKAIGDEPYLFPSLMVSMIAVGEQTAQLGTTSKKVSEFYDEEVDTFVGNLSTIMEPVVIVLVGVMVGGLVMAIMQPIMNLADLAALS